ncbi:DUF3253 domain-containing protein [uncultured Rhodospira sp.]|uniref:DUF3253 domain-containing protein n=1 Tax=uncultured Rhodospira sp. TaxID=1936189 RepID=UPI0026284425|nr:DUF3253 domain-containing protein [uncultured Rhodospira sp.]
MDHDAIADAILRRVATCDPGRTVAPADIAQDLAEGASGDWRALLRPVRTVAIALARQGRIGIYRKGKPVADPADVKGVIRLGAAPDGP